MIAFKDKLNTDQKNIIVLIFTAAVIKFWGITYGLPSVYNSTEYFIAKHALSFGARQTLEPLYFIYPTFYIYLITFLFGMYFVTGKVIGLFSLPADFAFQFFADPSSFYLLGRTLNAVAIILSLVIFYHAIRFILPSRFSLLLSMIFLFSYNINLFTFWMVPDAFLILGTVLVLYYIVKANFQKLTRTEIIITSIVAGLTISTKYNAGFLALGWLLTIWIYTTENLKRKIRFFILSGFLVLAGFIFGSPYWIISFSKFLQAFGMIWSQSKHTYNLDAGLPYLWELQSLIESEWILGIVLVILIFSLFLRINKKILPITAIIFPTFLIVGSWEKKGLDYLLIIFPTLLVLLAFWIGDLNKKEFYKKIVFLIVSLILLINIPRIIYQNYLKTCLDTRKITGQWIMDNLPTRSKICYDHYHFDIDLIDVQRFVKYGEGSKLLSPQIKEQILSLQNAPYNYSFVYSSKTVETPFVEDSLIPVVSKDPYLWENLRHPHKSVEELKTEGVKMLILNSDTYLKFLNNPPPPIDNPLRFSFINSMKFYQFVFDSLNPIKVIQPSCNRPGPTIKIYDFEGKN